MAFTANRNIDPHDYLQTNNYSGVGNTGWLEAANGPHRLLAYYDRLDVLIYTVDAGSASGDRSTAYIDPLWLDNQAPLFVPRAGFRGTTQRYHVSVGEWDKANNRQRLYVWLTPSGSFWHEVEPLSPEVTIESDVWPFNLLENTGHGFSSGDIGAFFGGGNEVGNAAFFESAGYALIPNVNVRHSDGTQYNRVLAQVDLTTGFATIVDIPVSYGTENHIFAASPLFGSNLNFDVIQFVADDVSTPANPVGALYFFSHVVDDPSDGSLSRAWYKVVDWNPAAISSTPNRIHRRQRIISGVVLEDGNPAALNGLYGGSVSNALNLYYHPRTNQLQASARKTSDTSFDPGDTKVFFFGPTPVFDSLIGPSPREVVATGKTVIFGAEARGSFDEEIPGVDVQFQLRRVSSVEEVLNVTPSAGESVAVANGPITDYGPVVVRKDGAALTEGVDYDVDRPNGEIDFIGPEPVGGSIYDVTYRHFATPATPPHGTLLNATAVSDLNGEVVARVEYDEEDPVPDRWDRLDADQI